MRRTSTPRSTWDLEPSGWTDPGYGKGGERRFHEDDSPDVYAEDEFDDDLADRIYSRIN